jgi:NADH-quinone oxidoreductase subunit G
VPRARSAGGIQVGTWRPLWASKEVDVSPHLQFARPQQVVEMSPADAERAGVGDGDVVEVAAAGDAGATVRGPVKLRAAIPAGSVFVALGTPDSPGNAVPAGPVEVRALAGVSAEPVPVLVGAGGDEAPEPPSAESPPGSASGFSDDGSAPRESEPGAPTA